MCGIAGFIDPGMRGSQADFAAVMNRMTDVIAHRGPDGSGAWSDPERGLCLGHRRLSIIDISGGAQPMASSDGDLVVVFNGEIYNHAQLREELIAKGHRFQSHHSDTEVLLYGWREWGEAMADRLNGMWAFAIYDRKHGIVHLSRDRFGQKPFYYTYQNGVFAFASELSGIEAFAKTSAAVSTSLSPRAVQKFFAYGYVPAPLSLYEGVYKLPGGHCLSFRLAERSFSVRQWWDFVLEPFAGNEIPKNPEEEWGAEIRSLLDQSVQRRMMSDVPLGVFLSGGIDSSAITAFASKHSEKLETFCIGFEEASFDESLYARDTAQLFGTSHHDDVLSMDGASDLLAEIASKLDEPLGDSSLLPTYLLCRFTRQRVTVALGGDGGDELFAGYDPFRALRYANLYKTLLPSPVHAGVRMVMARLPVSHRNMSLDFKIKRTLRGIGYKRQIWLPVWMGPLDPDGVRDLLNEPVDLEDLYSEAVEQWDACRSKNIVDKTLQFYTKLYLQDDILVKVDRASMMVSLEARSPFLDIDFINFVRRIPSSYKLRGGVTKYILKKALEPVLPASILYRAKKGFGVPVGRWFRDGVLNVDPKTMPAPVRPEFVKALNESHRLNKSDERAALWNAWLLGEFQKRGRSVGVA